MQVLRIASEASHETWHLHQSGYVLPKVGVSIEEEDIHFTLRPDLAGPKRFNEVLDSAEVSQCDVRILFKDSQTLQAVWAEARGGDGLALARAALLGGREGFTIEGLYSAPARSLLYQLKFSGPAGVSQTSAARRGSAAPLAEPEVVAEPAANFTTSLLWMMMGIVGVAAAGYTLSTHLVAGTVIAGTVKTACVSLPWLLEGVLGDACEGKECGDTTAGAHETIESAPSPAES